MSDAKVAVKYRLYIDVLFLINFIMDYIALIMVARVEGQRYSKARLTIAAFLGGMYSILIVATNMYVLLQNVCTYIAIPMLMAIIMTGRTSVPRVIRLTVLIYIVMFVLGGIGQALYYNTVIGYIARSKESWIFFLLLLVAAYICIGAIMTLIEVKKTYDTDKMYEVTFCLGEKNYSIRAMVDTGNVLVDSIYHVPVSVIEKDILKDWDSIINNPVTYKYHIISYKSLGMEQGIMEVLEVKDVLIKNASIELRLDRMMVGLYDGKLSGDREYKMLINGLNMKGGV